MDIERLAEEIRQDPLGNGYADLGDPQVADRLNAPARPGKKAVPATDVRRYVLLHGLWPKLQAVAASSANPVWQGTAITILQTLAPNSFDQIDMADPDTAAAVGQMLTTMVDAGVLTAQNRDEMVALGNAQISRAAELGLGAVHHLDVAEARRDNL